MTHRVTAKGESVYGYHEFTGEGFRAVVVPAFGGSLQELVMDNIELMSGSTADGTGLTDYREFCRSGLLFPFPNRIRDGQYSFETHAYQLPLNDTQFGHAIHGLVYNREFSVVRTWDQGIHLECRHKGTEGYPFPFTFEAIYRFTSASLDLELSVRNTGARSMPVGFGWHPYFKINGASELKFQADTRFPCDSRMIPIGLEEASVNGIDLKAQNWDEAFRLSDKRVLLCMDTYSLEFLLEDDSYLQVYTPADKRSVAIEPMSCIADAYNNETGLQVLPAGARSEWNVKLRFHRQPIC